MRLNQIWFVKHVLTWGNKKNPNIKEFLALKKQERVPKCFLKSSNSNDNCEAGVTHPNTPTTHNSADTAHSRQITGERARGRENQTNPGQLQLKGKEIIDDIFNW